MDFFKTGGCGLSRRWIATLGACISTSVCLLLTPVSPAEAAPTLSRPADSFVGSIGINTHLYYSDTPYGEKFELVKKRLAELGVRHVRENLAPNYRPDQYQHLRELAAMGIKADLILGDPTNGTSKLDEMLAIVKSQLSGALDAVEGPNEFDARGITNWQTMLLQYQQHLYMAVKSDPQLAPLTVVGPSIVRDPHEREIGDISQMMDVGNIHSYAPVYAPEKLVPEFLERARFNAGPTSPVWATETGYNTALNYRGELPPVSESAMASYMPRVFLEHFRQGFNRTYSYELLDEFPDPGQAERESHWGLLRNDLSPKPAFESVRNLITILKDPGPEFTPERLDYTISGDQTNLRQLLLQKRDGSFYLVLWRSTSVWDTTNQAPLNPGSTPVTVNFGQTISEAERYLPNVSSAPVEGTSGPKSLHVEVGPNVVIVKLTPGASSGPSEASPTPVSKPEPSLTPGPSSNPGPAPTAEAAPVQTAAEPKATATESISNGGAVSPPAGQRRRHSGTKKGSVRRPGKRGTRAKANSPQAKRATRQPPVAAPAPVA